MEIFFLKGKDPHETSASERTWIVVADSEIDSRKLLPADFEVYEVEIRSGDLGGLSGVIGWVGEPMPGPGEEAET